MRRKILILLFLLIPAFCFAEWRNNPYTYKPDYYEGNATNDLKYLRLNGSNANTAINISSQDFLTSGNGTFGKLFVNDNITVKLSNSFNQIKIQQTNTTGTEWVSGNPTGLIWINDTRTGATVNEKEEATLVITGTAAMQSAYFPGYTYFGNQITSVGGLFFKGDDNVGYFAVGADADMVMAWDLNGAGDDFFHTALRRQAATDSAVWYLFTDYTNNNPSGTTDFDNYISPTFAILNSNGADKADFAAVVIGERTQNNVTTVHYFDFYAMTGASDGSINVTTTEIPAMFRIGDSGNKIPLRGLSSGDVLFEDDIEINGTVYLEGGLQAQGVAGLSAVKTVKGSDGNNCTMTFAFGICTATTCP
jgi:hypothetical protein